MGYTLEFLKALALTIAIEVPLLFVGARFLLKLKPKALSNATLFGAGILASFATLPYLWFVLPDFIPNYTLFLLIGEVSVALFETLIYWLILRVSLPKALLLSLFCNLASFGLGKILLQ